MDVKMHEKLPRRRQRTVLLVLVALVLLHGVPAAQGLTGALIGTVKDDQGGVLASAVVRLGSPALIGGLVTVTTNERGQLRFPSLPPGVYELDITMPGFATLHEASILIGAGATIERTVVLKLAGVAESVVVQGAGSRIDARNPGFGIASGPRTSKRSRRGEPVCSTGSEPPLGSRRLRRQVVSRRPSPRSVPAPMKTSICSTV